MRYLKIVSLFLPFYIGFQCIAQTQISEIDLSKIPHQKVRKFLENQKSSNINTMLDIKPSLLPNNDNSGFRIDERIYVVKGKPGKVWQHYIITNPVDSWNGRKISFGLLLSKKEKKVVYNGESVSRIDTGQVVYLNLKILSGLANLATVFEFTSVDEKNKSLEFSYIDGNTTLGTQNLKFIETSKGYTEIIHTSHFKSNSRIRDRVYPFFHTRIINDFHRNLKELFHARNLQTNKEVNLVEHPIPTEIKNERSLVQASE